MERKALRGVAIAKTKDNSNQWFATWYTLNHISV